jgi:hypothetical protein
MEMPSMKSMPMSKAKSVKVKIKFDGGKTERKIAKKSERSSGRK